MCAETRRSPLWFYGPSANFDPTVGRGYCGVWEGIPPNTCYDSSHIKRAKVAYIITINTKGVFILKKRFVISPEVINILGTDPDFHAWSSEKQSQPEPEPQKRSFWQRAGDFFKKSEKLIKRVTAVIVAVGAAFFAAVVLKRAHAEWKAA